jgi:hypothetical protein
MNICSIEEMIKQKKTLEKIYKMVDFFCADNPLA